MTILGGYDYYCYLEDDLLVFDPWFFVKVRWFASLAGSDCLLQPNRFEASVRGPVRKAYVDGDLALRITAPFQDIRAKPVQFHGRVMGTPVSFRRVLNPHSGCFFLGAEQMARWARQSYFLDRDTSFIGPLESAATLGVMRTFRVYKPDAASASFLEVRHHGSAFLGLIGHTVRLVAAE
jgi:hypothetical protein